MASFPGHDADGFIDPTSHCVPVFTSTTARDTYVTAAGGASGVLKTKGFVCVVDTGAAWSLHYLTAAGLWKTATLA